MDNFTIFMIVVGVIALLLILWAIAVASGPSNRRNSRSSGDSWFFFDCDGGGCDGGGD